MKTYSCSYQFNGRQHVVHVAAADAAECSRKLRAIGMTGQAEQTIRKDEPVRCRYRFGERHLEVDVFAADERECSAKLRAIGTTARIDGELITEVSLPRPFGRLVDGVYSLMGGRP